MSWIVGLMRLDKPQPYAYFLIARPAKEWDIAKRSEFRVRQLDFPNVTAVRRRNPELYVVVQLSGLEHIFDRLID